MYWLIKFYRWLRNLDALEDAYALSSEACRAAATAHAAAYAAAEQLRMCRSLLAATMTERDGLEAALALAEAELQAARLDAYQVRQRRRAERAAIRYWLTRTVRPQKVSVN